MTSLSAARMSQAARDAARMKQLFEKEVISREAYEKAQTDAEVAKAQDDLAQEGLRLAEAAIPTQKALIAQRQAIIAQRQSLVAQRQARIGQQEALVEATGILPGGGEAAPTATPRSSPRRTGSSPGRTWRRARSSPPASRSWPSRPWTTCGLLANYKETDIERIRPGQEVEIRVDTFTGKEVPGQSRQHHGGDRFRLRPLSAGERLGELREGRAARPVKILLSRGEDPGHILGIGMSVVPTILVR